MPKKLTKEEFIEKAKLIHGDKYDYSLVDYVNNFTKVKIICLTHGIFEQIPKDHLRAFGCIMCGLNRNSERRASTSKSFIKKAILVHGNKYDYSLVDYKRSKKKVKIICQKHGVFEQLPNYHLSGNGCRLCKNEKLTLINRCSSEEFIEKAKLVHENKYDYSLVFYVKNNLKIKIICPTHGEFLQTPHGHLSKQGCPVCKESKGEKEIAKILTEMNIEFEREKKFKECVNIRPLPFDFYIPSKNIAIEFQGKQHYEAIDVFGGKEQFLKQQINDKIKTEYCLTKNIKLVIIKYDEDVKEVLDEFM